MSTTTTTAAPTTTTTTTTTTTAGAIDQQMLLIEGMTSPANDAAAVTPSDTAPLVYVSRALYVGGAGNLVVTMQGGGNVTFTGVPAGTVLPIRCSHVLSTSTTATSIVNLY
jgi:hypothetical protein